LFWTATSNVGKAIHRLKMSDSKSPHHTEGFRELVTGTQKTVQKACVGKGALKLLIRKITHFPVDTCKPFRQWARTHGDFSSLSFPLTFQKDSLRSQYESHVVLGFGLFPLVCFNPLLWILLYIQ
jgi:hypothetical protein